jgi:carboxypeptidase Q
VTASVYRSLGLSTLLAVLLAASTIALPAQRPATTRSPAQADRADLDAIARIKDEGLQRSEVMETAWQLTEVFGPRLTNSPGMRAAGEWAITRLTEWGLTNAHKAVWGPFGRGWANESLIANEVAPLARPLTAYARAWTPGTAGSISGDAILVVLEREADFKTWEGKLSGRIVLTQRPAAVPPLFTPLAERHGEQQLRDIEAQVIPAARPVTTPPTAPDALQRPSDPEVPFATQRMRFLAREGVAAVLEPGTGRNDHGAVLVGGASANRDAKEPPVPPQLVVATEQYNRLARLLMRNQRVALELDVRNRFFDDTLDSFNVIAEIPGTDRGDEVVMLGAHLDSWHAGTGATDNAAGTAVMMEAMRILKKTGLPMRRTVRMALWTGEEQGLLGSTAYVREHFADRDTMALKPAHAKMAAYFNMDNGTGAIRGVYLEGNEAVRPIFEAWMEPLRSLGMTTLTIRSTGGTDHLPFDRVGLPGFQFVQDWVEYRSHTHHTNMDVFDRLQSEDLMKNAVIVASFVYHAATRDERLPRKALPAPAKPTPAKPAATATK